MPSGTADINLRKMTFAETQFGNADIRLHSNGQKITIKTFELRKAKDRVDLQGSYDLKSQVLENVK